MWHTSGWLSRRKLALPFFVKPSHTFSISRAASSTATCVCKGAATLVVDCKKKKKRESIYRRLIVKQTAQLSNQKCRQRRVDACFHFLRLQTRRGSDLKCRAEPLLQRQKLHSGGFVASTGSWWSSLSTSRPPMWRMLCSVSRSTRRAEAPCASPATTCSSRTGRRARGAALGRFYCYSGISMPLRKGEGVKRQFSLPVAENMTNTH